MVPVTSPCPWACVTVTVPLLSLIQLKDVEATVPGKIIVAIALPEQMVWAEFVAVTFGLGLTETVAVITVPLQPLALGVMVKVTVWRMLDVLVKFPLISVVPLFAMPVIIPVLSLIQVNVVPATRLDKTMVEIAASEHIV